MFHVLPQRKTFANLEEHCADKLRNISLTEKFSVIFIPISSIQLGFDVDLSSNL